MDSITPVSVRAAALLERVSQLLATHRYEIMNAGSHFGHFWLFGRNLTLYNFMFKPKVAVIGAIVHDSTSVGGHQMRKALYWSGRRRGSRRLYSLEATLEGTQGQILSQSPTYATRFWWHLYGS